MKNVTRPKIAVSISDIPLGISLEKSFAVAKDLKVDGVEVILGYKSHINFKKLIKLSEKYDMPVLSVHEPLWSFLGLVREEKSFKIAKFFGAKYIVHPSFKSSLSSKKTHLFLRWLFFMAQKYDIDVLIENMGDPIFPILKPIIRRDKSITDLKCLMLICRNYGFGFTLDTSHLNYSNPLNANGFSEMSPYLRNIHLSDFNKSAQHLPLGEGILDVEKFLGFLKRINYAGFLTLELNSKVFSSRRNYIKDIHKSIKLIQKNFKN